MKTIALDPVTWDLYKDPNGSIALAPQPGAIAQDVATVIRTFRNELWYDKSRGMPYLERILGQLPPSGFIIAQIKALALSIPGVASVKVTLDPLTNSRVLTGKIEITDQAGALVGVIGISGTPWYQIAASGEHGPNLFILDQSLLGGSDVLI
jgi:hypothetical protein